MKILAEDVRPTASVTAVFPARHEVIAAVWGSAVEASGGPAARTILECLHELAEQYARLIHAEERQQRTELGDAEFAWRRDNLMARINYAVVDQLPGLSERTRDGILSVFDELTALAVRTHRACRTLGADDPVVHALWERLAGLCDSYTYMVAGLTGVPPWLVALEPESQQSERRS